MIIRLLLSSGQARLVPRRRSKNLEYGAREALSNLITITVPVTVTITTGSGLRDTLELN